LSYITSYYHGLPCSTDCTPLSDSLTLGVGSMAIVVRTGLEPVFSIIITKFRLHCFCLLGIEFRILSASTFRHLTISLYGPKCKQV